MTLSVGQRLTLLRIDDCMAMTHRYELEVRTVVPATRVGYGNLKERVAIARQRGKRKDFFLDLARDDIVLDAWAVPFQTDGEAGGVFSGNGCYNLIGGPQAIRECLQTRAVYPVCDEAKANIIVGRGPRTSCTDDGLELLYPDIETHHAVANRMKEARQTAQQAENPPYSAA